nr:MAG TPA_asm: hypothetical protein [Bacteriophage sp.]
MYSIKVIRRINIFLLRRIILFKDSTREVLNYGYHE